MDVNNGKIKQSEKAEQSSSEVHLPVRRKNIFLPFLFGMMYTVWGYLLGGAVLPFGAEPLGIALLCGSDRKVFYIYAGLCVSAWGRSERFLLIGIYTAVLLLRAGVRFVLDKPSAWETGIRYGERRFWQIYPFLFSEHFGLRMATSALAAFGIGLARLIGNGFLYYDLYGTILAVLAAPTAVLLFSGFFTDRAVGIYRTLSGFLALAFALIWSAGDITIYGISASVCGCMLVTLYLCRKHGIVAGMITGTVCGLAVAPQLAPLFAFAALSAGLLFPVSVSFAASAAFSVGIAWGIYVRGIGILNGVLGGLLTATVLFTVWDKLFLSSPGKKTGVEGVEPSSESIACAPFSEQDFDWIKWRDTGRRIRELCAGFSSLSEIFWGVSRKMQTPTATDLRQICDNAFDASCATCTNKNRCWGEQYRKTTGELEHLGMLLHRNGHLETDDAGTWLRTECHRLPDILEEINHHTAEHKKQLLQGDQTEIFAMDYQAISDLLGVSMAEQNEEYEIHAEQSGKLCQALEAEAFGVTHACVWGKRRRHVMIGGLNGEVLQSNQDAIGATVARVCSFSVEEGVPVENGRPILEFAEKETISVICAQRNLCADGEEKYCGDTAGLFHHRDGRFYAFISDGMGSGREAALTSGISGLFLRKMLGMGVPCETTLRMLNGFLRNRGSGSLHECSATVDLMELDLMQSRASFYKSGAAPTYVFRNGSLLKLRSHTVPVGILRELDTGKIDFAVSEDDIIVMVSDGVTQGREECAWLFDLIRSQGDSVAPDRLANLIVKYAKEEGGTDDMSVLVMKITSA